MINRLVFLLGLVAQLFLGSAYSASVVTSSSGIAADGTAETLPASNLPTASSSALGVVQCGSGTSCTAGVLSVSGSGGAGPVMLYSQLSTGVSAITITDVISGSYNSYHVIISGATTSTAMTPVSIRYSTDNGSTYDSSTLYRMSCFFNLSTGSNGNCGSSGFTTSFGISSGGSIAAPGASSCEFDLYNMSSSSLYKSGSGLCSVTITGPVSTISMNSFEYESTTAVNAFEIFPSTGTITAYVQVVGYP